MLPPVRAIERVSFPVVLSRPVSASLSRASIAIAIKLLFIFHIKLTSPPPLTGYRLAHQDTSRLVRARVVDQPLLLLLVAPDVRLNRKRCDHPPL